jgi:tetratricopeptide (TPR) repeat protein
MDLVKIFFPMILSLVSSLAIDANCSGDTDKCTAHLEQGVDLFQRHEFAAAEKEFQVALSVAQSEKNQLEINSCFNNLAALAMASGNLPDAEKYYLKLVGEKVLPAGVSAVDIKLLLANVYVREGKEEQAESVNRQVLAQATDTPRGKLITARACINIAAILRNKGKLADSLQMYKKATDILSACSGPTAEALTARTLNDVSLLCLDMGDLKSAEEGVRAALERTKKIYGTAHPNTASTLGNLGSVLHAQGDNAGAEKSIKEAMDIYVQTRTDTEPHRLTTWNSLGCVYLDEGKFVDAEKLLKDAVALSRRHEFSSFLVQSLTNLASVYAAQGKHVLAAQTFDEAMQLAVKSKSTLDVNRVKAAKEKYSRAK